MRYYGKLPTESTNDNHTYIYIYIYIFIYLSEGHILLVGEKRLHSRILGVERNETAAC